MTPAAPVALLCDYAGVLTTSMYGAAQQVCREFGVDYPHFRATLRALRDVDDPVERIECGEVVRTEFLEQFHVQLTESLGGLDGERFLDRMAELIQPEPGMNAAVERLRAAGIPTALVSNSWDNAYPPEVLARFDVVVLSGEVGLRKPDADIFELTAKQLGVEPDQCVLVDDFEVNTAGASALGIRTILHTDVDATLRQLSAWFGVSLAL
ncbi:HAD family hydrolase [Sporichthya polymorpha]|uniref:HAD family hydrolase n=1 Tax=Sporichthya polymorpha TaxID=35751 RepID=UPI00036E25A0|nr:HAD family phosphatase [Sporichthya polymorpha]